jgi:DNA-binding NarL/FixJ family response regulator
VLQPGEILEATKPLRVLIAENHRDLSDVMSQLIDTEPGMQCVGQVSNAADVLPAARDASADVLILDLMLQGGAHHRASGPPRHHFQRTRQQRRGGSRGQATGGRRVCHQGV